MIGKKKIGMKTSNATSEQTNIKSLAELILLSERKLDIAQEVKRDIVKKIENDETNNFNFYNVSSNVETSEEDEKKLKKKINFKSIHDVGDLQNRAYINKITKKIEYTGLEKEIKDDYFKKQNSKIILSEVYNNIDVELSKDNSLPSKTETDLPYIISLEKTVLKAKAAKSRPPTLFPKLGSPAGKTPNIDLQSPVASVKQRIIGEFAKKVQRKMEMEDRKKKMLFQGNTCKTENDANKNGAHLLSVEKKNLIDSSIEPKKQSDAALAHSILNNPSTGKQTDFTSIYTKNKNINFNISEIKNNLDSPTSETQKKMDSAKYSDNNSFAFEKDSLEEATYKKYNLEKGNKAGAVFFGEEEERHEDKTEKFLENLKRNIKIVVKMQGEGGVVEQAEFFEKQVELIEEKCMQKIKNMEILLVTKERNTQLIRKENIFIIERIKNIKELMYSLNMEVTEKRNLKNSAGRKSTPSNKGPTIRLMASLKDTNAKEKEINELIEQIKTLKESEDSHYRKVHYNNGIITESERNKKAVKNNIKKIHHMRTKFFIKILKSGKDVRNTGLSWLIKKLWQLGEKISEEHLPDYLDQRAKEFLIFKAKKELSICEYELFSKLGVEILKSNMLENQNEIINKDFILLDDPSLRKESEEKCEMNKMRRRMSLGRSKSNPFDSIENLEYDLKKAMEQSVLTKNNQNKFETKVKEIIYKNLGSLVFTTSKESIHNILYKHIREKIKVFTKPNYINIAESQKEKTHFDEMSSLTFTMNYTSDLSKNLSLFENNSQIQDHTNREQFLKDIDNLQKKMLDSQNSIQNMQKNEIHRIIKEFDFRNYGKRFNTDPFTVISSLIGVKNALKEMAKNGMNVNYGLNKSAMNKPG